MLVLTIVLCTITWVLLALYVQRNARRRLALTPERPDKPYDTSDHYVIGGRWGFSPLTGELGYESYKFADAMTATYMCAWLNNAHDHRSLEMAFFDWAARVEADRLKQERQREAKLARSLTRADALDPCYCNTCDRYINRNDRHVGSFLRTGRCVECDVKYHERRVVATYRVPGPILGDVVRYVPGLEITTLRAAATRFTTSKGPR